MPWLLQKYPSRNRPGGAQEAYDLSCKGDNNARKPFALSVSTLQNTVKSDHSKTPGNLRDPRKIMVTTEIEQDINIPPPMTWSENWSDKTPVDIV